MEADFTRFYGEDLRALCWGVTPWGVRRLLTHVSNLPRDSAFARSVRGEHAYWDETPELLAQLIDAVERQSFYFRKANFADAGEPPTVVPRPGVKPAEPETVSLTQLKTILKG